ARGASAGALAGGRGVVSARAGGDPAPWGAPGLGAPQAPPKPTMPGVVSVSPAQGPRSYDGPDGAALTIPVPPPMQAQAQPPAATPPPAGPGRNTVTIIDGSTGQRQEVPIPAAQDSRAPAEQRLP